MLRTAYSNWELSSDRANSARRLLQDDGVKPDQVAQVRGYADQSLRVPTDPLSASNRRISIVVQFLAAPEGSKGTEILNAAGDDAKEGEAAKSGGGEKAKSAAGETAPPKPLEVQPSTGKIDLPPIPAGAAKPSAGTTKAVKPSAATTASVPGKAANDLADQINQLRQMKQADVGRGK